MSDSQFAYLLIVPVMVAILAVTIYPTLYSVWVSFNEVDIRTMTWKFVGLHQYVKVLTDKDTYHGLKITAMYTLEVTLFSLIVSLVGALVLNEKFKGKAFLTVLVVLPWALSPYSAGVIWSYLYHTQFGLFNAILMNLGLGSSPFDFLTRELVVTCLAIAHAWQISPLGIYFLLASLQIIPEDLYKMAKIDRLGPLGRFRHVVFPYLTWPILIFLALVTAEAAKTFDLTYFLSNGGPGRASTSLIWEIYTQSFRILNLGYGAAQSWLLIFFITAISMVYFYLVFVRGRKI